MTPIYDRHTELSGWFDGENIFDLNLNWVAFLNDGNFFSSDSLHWLGPFNEGSLLDRNGKPVLWLDGATPRGALKPFIPLRPLKPLTPLRTLKPLNPLGGWSKLNWDQWLNV